MGENSTRTKIIECADQLFYEQGFEHTSFMDIADIVNISKGNFYYHFKSKDEILDAVIQLRLSYTQTMLDEWEKNSNPLERIKSFINILIRNQAKILRFGCPIGTLTTELSKLDHKAKPDANKLFSLFRHWLCQQFEALGYADKADNLAMHLLKMVKP